MYYCYLSSQLGYPFKTLVDISKFNLDTLIRLSLQTIILFFLPTESLSIDDHLENVSSICDDSLFISRLNYQYLLLSVI